MSEPVQAQVEETQKNSIAENLRKQREHYEYEMGKLAKEKAALEQQLQKQYAPRVEEEDDEPYVDNKKLKKVLSSFELEIEKKIEQKAEQKARMLVEEDKTARYLKENSDFNQIMNSDIVQKFADAHPALAENILRMPEGFERQKLVYQTIKSMGFDKPKAAITSTQERVNHNMRNPGYHPSESGSSPYQSQGDFSPSGQKNAYEKMKQLINNRRG